MGTLTCACASVALKLKLHITNNRLFKDGFMARPPG
jgi:hypothetical protein